MAGRYLSYFHQSRRSKAHQARMAVLGVTSPASSPILDTSVEDRLQHEKKEAEAKAKGQKVGDAIAFG